MMLFGVLVVSAVLVRAPPGTPLATALLLIRTAVGHTISFGIGLLGAALSLVGIRLG
jgi:hypothetical protein